MHHGENMTKRKVSKSHKPRTPRKADFDSDLSSIVEFTTTNIPHLLPLLNELIICAEEEK